ncbi:MAG: hypothetical protein ACI8S6_003534 [Myxococcota bacterium]|jgi:hypothetical protein
MNDEEVIQLETPLLSGALKAALGLVVASFLIAFTSQRTANGEITLFRDWGAVAFGAASIGAALIGLKAAMSPLERQHRNMRMLIIAVISATGVYRVLYGLGMFV